MAKNKCGMCGADAGAKQGAKVHAYWAHDSAKVKATIE